MRRTIYRLVDTWLGRGRDRDPRLTAAARAAVAGLAPATVVTGGSRGIGLAIAHRFAADGHRVAIVARNRDALEAAATEIERRHGGPVQTIACDITASDASAIIERALRDAGLYPDVLVNNAAVGLAGAFTTHPTGEIDKLTDLNVVALTRLTRAFLPDMIARRRGGVLNIASLGAVIPGPHQAAYYASKAYVLSLSEALRSECSGQGVRIAVVLPGPVTTTFHAAMGAEGSLYRRILPALTPDAAARSAVGGFMLGRTVIVPGALNEVFYIFLKVLPHGMTVPLMRLLLRRDQN